MAECGYEKKAMEIHSHPSSPSSYMCAARVAPIQRHYNEYDDMITESTLNHARFTQGLATPPTLSATATLQTVRLIASAVARIIAASEVANGAEVAATIVTFVTAHIADIDGVTSWADASAPLFNQMMTYALAYLTTFAPASASNTDYMQYADEERARVAADLTSLLEAIDLSKTMPPLAAVETCDVCYSGEFMHITPMQSRGADEPLFMIYTCKNPIHGGQPVSRRK